MKIVFLIIPAILIASVLQAQKKLPLSFEETFETNTNRWYNVKEYGTFLRHNALYVNPKKDFRLVAEFDSKALKESGYWGMQCGRKHAYDYFFFEINDKQQFQIGYQINKNRNVIEHWRKKKKIIQTDSNVLEIRKTGEQLYFYINGKKVYDLPDMEFEQSGVGVYTSLEEVACTKFQIYQDKGAINVAEEVKDLKLERQNLGEAVNSEYIDKSPIISPDGKTLYFLVEHHKDGFGEQDIYFSTTENGSQWSKAQNIGRPLNNERSNFVNAIMPDNNTMLVINNYGLDDDPNAIVALTHRTKDGWAFPKPVLIQNCKKRGRWVSFRLSADGKTLMFSMKRPDTKGGRDIYVSFLRPNGRFSVPINLGPTINTLGNEHHPVLAADGVTLYFDTDGHPGYGGRDIFMSRRLDESWTNWSTPQNLGPIINGKGADEGFMIPASGDYAYFVSDENSYGGLDIYRMRLPESLRPRPASLLTGNVIEKGTENPIETTLRVYRKGSTKIIAHARTHPATGRYKVALASGHRYTIIADHNPAEERCLDTLEVDLTDLPKYEERDLPPIRLERLKKEIPKPIPRAQLDLPPFESIYFEPTQWSLTDVALATLSKIADTLLKYPALMVEVVGHTDSIGSFEDNWELAVARSNAAIAFLENKGVNRLRFMFKGFGEMQPIETNETDKGRAKNRRVEFRVVQ